MIGIELLLTGPTCRSYKREPSIINRKKSSPKKEVMKSRGAAFTMIRFQIDMLNVNFLILKC